MKRERDHQQSKLYAETERLCNRLMSSDPDFDDCAEAADHIRTLQAEVDRLQAECEALRLHWRV